TGLMILVCGEALFDVFLADEATSNTAQMQAVAGGSPFNVAIGIARLGRRAALLGGISHDMLGRRLRAMLGREKVSCDYLIPSTNRTTLSLVGVGEDGQPSYIFYGANSADCSVAVTDLPELDPDIHTLHFGSYSLVVPPVADALAVLVDDYKDRFISVDPNVRPAIEPDLDRWRERLAYFATRADLIKVSTEDLGTLYPGQAPEQMAHEWLGRGVSLVVVTDTAAPLTCWSRQGDRVQVLPEATPIIDTVGAGDSVQAALLVWLSQAGNGDPGQVLDDLGAAELEQMLGFAASTARITCSRRGADLPRLDELG
ncbi:MAG: carbohydrate kinase, partial [Pseudomonadota bacterium]